MHAGVFLHCLSDVHGLEGYAFEGCAGDVGRSGAAGDAADGALGIRIPVRGAEAGEGRYEVDTAVVGHGQCQCFNLRRTLDDAEAVAQPLDDAASDEDGAFEGVVDLVANLPGDRCEEVVAAHDGLAAGVHKEEAAGAVGVFDVARGGAHLSEEGGLLVTCDAGDGHFVGEDGGFRVAVDFGRRRHAR